MKHLTTKTQFGFSILPFALCIFFILLSACDGGSGTSDEASSDTGSIAFSLVWEEDTSKSGVRRAALASSNDVCMDYKIETISAKVYNSSDAEIALGSWPCSAHQGTISDVPTGSGMWVKVQGSVPGEGVVFEGKTEKNITVTAEQTTNAGTVTMNYIGIDTTPPEVALTNPSDRDTGVALNVAITATFSEDMVSASVNATTFTLETDGTRLDGSVKYDSSTLTATFTPDSNLSFSTNHTITITTDVEDLAGNQMTDNYTWSFTTSSGSDIIPPTAGSPGPQDGAIDVAVNSVVTATFSEAVDPASVNASSFTLMAGTTRVNGSVTYNSSARTATFTPDSNLSFSTNHTVTITTDVEDIAGNQMADNYTWSFTTGSDSSVGWQKNDMGFTLVEQKHVVVGDGRNDGVMRMYSAVDDKFYEYTYSADHWEHSNSFGDILLGSINKIAIGTVRNDGVYTVCATTSFHLHEYYYEIDSWLGGDTGGDWTLPKDELVLGNARNDGNIRIYMADMDGISEVSYNYGDWAVMSINDADLSYGFGGLVVTDGRNDGVLRLYAAIDDHVYEYLWTGSTWEVEDCGVIDDVYRFADMCAGNGRNDGKNRIYLGTGGGDLYELSYDGENWEYIVISESVSIDYITIANGRNDGITRIYTGGSAGIGEYTYSGTWAKTALIDLGFGVSGITVGNGRNDGVNRVYVTGDDNHIYEYSFE